MEVRIIRILSRIGQDAGCYSAAQLAAEMQGLQPNDKLIVIIASDGGEVYEGEKMFNLLRGAVCPVEMRAIGLVASIATLIYLSSPNRTALSNARFMIHSPYVQAGGINFKQAKQITAEMEAEHNRLVGYYALAGIDTKNEQFNSLMDNATFFTAIEAKKIGFVKNIIYKQNKVLAMSILNDAKALLGTLSNFVKGAKAEMISATTSDGTALLMSSESGLPEIGSAVTYDDGTPCEAGAYMLADGSMIEVDDKGILLTYTPDEVELTPDANMDGSDEVSALKAELAALKAEKEVSVKEMEETKAVLAELSKKVSTLAKVAPVAAFKTPSAAVHAEAQKAKANAPVNLEAEAWNRIVAAKKQHGYISEQNLPVNIR